MNNVITRLDEVWNQHEMRALAELFAENADDVGRGPQPVIRKGQRATANAPMSVQPPRQVQKSLTRWGVMSGRATVGG